MAHVRAIYAPSAPQELLSIQNVKFYFVLAMHHGSKKCLLYKKFSPKRRKALKRNPPWRTD
jgi:hypothetical protein